MKTALITGITGQDGSYLTELLLAKGYEVHGIIRRASTFTTTRIDHLYRDPVRDPGRLTLHYGDLTDGCRLANLVSAIAPDEVYHLAAQSHVRVSFDEPVFTGDTTGLGTTRLLETIRMVDLPCRFYQASSSEMFGETPPPHDEKSPLRPQSPYAAAKTYAYWVTRNYREGYGMYAVNGILFNHESPRRGETFVTRKITRAAALIRAGKQDVLHLGNLDATRDWGYAPEYVEAMWLMLQQDSPDDYVVATGVPCTVEEFLGHAFTHAGLDWREHVRFDERYLRPVEVHALIGDAGKAARELGWRARVHAPELARLMVDADLADVLGGGAPRPRSAPHDATRQATLPRGDGHPPPPAGGHQPAAPHHSAPHHSAPHHSAPQPHHTAPQHQPHHSAPHHSAPQPHHTAPQHQTYPSAPHHSAPQPHHTAPQHQPHHSAAPEATPRTGARQATR